MKHLVQICGDPTVDWFRIHNEDIIVRGGVYYWTKTDDDTRVRLSSKPGGSAMIAQLLKEMIPRDLARVEGATLDESLLSRPKDRQITTSWTLWREFPNPGFNHTSYRLEKWHEFEPGNWDYPAAKLYGYPDLLLIQDSNLGFRTCREGWPEALTTDSREKYPRDIIILLGQYNDGHENQLLNRIDEAGLADRTTIVSSLSDLRACAVKIGMSLSWERMLEEVVAAVLSKNCPFVATDGQSIKYKQIIVTLGASGMIIVGRDKCDLIFDRSCQEGDFASQYPGQIMGNHACLLGALATSWVEDPDGLDWQRACIKGLKLARILHILGFEVNEEKQNRYLSFPYQTVTGFYQRLSLNDDNDDYPIINQVGDMGFFHADNETIMNKTEGDNWTILEENLIKKQKHQQRDPQDAVNECARNIVLKGPLVALPDIPVESIGAWSSADRQEIEGVRSVKNAMRDYAQLKNPDKPLCVAVFGPPGAGKSFVVTEIARGLNIGQEAQLTFNLSQFESYQELQTAFHQIRDLNLKGKMPLVFWDEFDTPCEGNVLGWLRYFLAPMQDGVFSDRGVSHPLGGGIYVFAGATHHSFEDFRKGDNAEARNAKKPDFISRLRAFINIRGINGNPNTVEDRLYMIRRAFILRQYLETNAPQIRNEDQFVIENGVLDAFLRVNKYYHGARSMENLIKMSSLADKRKFELSSLPPDNIIEMHVNVKEFNALTSMGDRKTLRIGIIGHTRLNPEQIDRLEQAVDSVICFIEKRYPRHYLTVFSPLAAGADRLVARRLLNREASRLIAILPVPESQYVKSPGGLGNAQEAELQNELKYWLAHKTIEIIEMPPSATIRSAYLKAGNFIAENSDVIITLWDGNEDKDSSITTNIIARARQLGKPICHIWADNYKPAAHIAVGEERCGEIRYLNFPAHPGTD